MFLQDRVGPDRAGPFGLLQPLADAVKLFTKEEFFPAGANRALFVFGPCLVTALMSSAVIIAQNHYELPVVNPQVILDLPESTTRELERNPPLRLGG